MSVPTALADACPVCPPPFDHDGCPPTAIQGAGAGIITAHACPRCGSSWRLWCDTSGWPVVRVLDPVSPAQAVINRGVLELALAEQDRERRHAAA